MPLFAGIDAERVERIAASFEERTVSTGARLTTEGASGYLFFLVQEGTADVLVDERPVAALGPGDFFGEVAMLGETGRRMAEVVATSPMRLAVMFGSEFRRMETEAPEVIDRLRSAMQSRLAAAAGM